MRIALTGASGFLGGALVKALLQDGHELVILTRDASRRPTRPRTQFVTWTPPHGPTAARVVDGVDAVINLAGESMAAGRWSDERKERIRTSRVATTQALAGAIRSAASPPAVFISMSAVGYYGPRGDEVLTEAASPGTDFVARLCAEWEDEALASASPRTRVVRLRTGLVVDPAGGALQRMLLPFRLGAGGPLGSGRQVLVVDSPRRLGQFRQVVARDTNSGRRVQCHCAGARDQRGVRSRAWACLAPAGVHAHTRIHAAAAVW